MSGLEDLGELVAAASRSYSSVQDTVSGALREAILRGVLKSGEQLKQEVIAERFGVSKIPVREALKQLEGEGLVTFYPRRGAIVAELSYAEVREVGEIRAALEVLALRWSMPRLTEDVLQRAEDILDLIDLADSGTDGIEDYGQLNWRFHEAILAPADRPRLLALIGTQHATFQRYLKTYPAMMSYRRQGQREHRRILDLCRRKDLATATQTLDQHIATVIQNLADCFDGADPTPS